MKCFQCAHENPSGARFCNSCGKHMGHEPHNDIRKCVSCGKRMSHEVYFNVCQHCGFAYRIKISKPNGSRAVTTWTYILLYYVSFLIPGAGLLIGGVYMSTPGSERRLGKDCAALGAINLAVFALLAYYFSSVIWV